MAVALDTAGAPVFTGGGTSLVTGSFTVGSSSVTALLAVLNIGQTSGGAAASSVTCAWNGISMTQLTGPVVNGSFFTTGTTYFFWLANPAVGAFTAAASWTNTDQVGGFSLISFTGTDTTTPFVNFNSNTGTNSDPATVTITVPANGGAVAMAMDCSNNLDPAPGGMTGTGVTPWFADTNTIQSMAGYGFGSSNLTFNAVHSFGATSNKWSAVGVAIQPPIGISPCGQIWM